MLRVISILLLMLLLPAIAACATIPESKPPGNEPGLDSTFTLDQLEPKILPYVFTRQGTWIVKPVKIEARDKKKALNAMNRTLQTISTRLKPLPSHRGEESIIPKIKITPITISKEGRSVNTLGWFDTEFNAIVLTWDIVKVGDRALQYVFSHELGHWVWYYVLTETDKERYRALLNNDSTRRHLNDVEDPGLNRDVIEEERFADDFRVYACGVPDYPYLLVTSLGKSPGDPAELQDYFNRFIVVGTGTGTTGTGHNLFPETSGLNNLN